MQKTEENQVTRTNTQQEQHNTRLDKNMPMGSGEPPLLTIKLALGIG